jgi:hypothetical protein
VKKETASVLAGLTLTAGALLTAPAAAADQQSYLDALHAQGITSEKGDGALFQAGAGVCKATSLYMRGGDWAFLGARRKAAEDLVNDNLHVPRSMAITVANTAIDQLCPQYAPTLPAV